MSLRRTVTEKDNPIYTILANAVLVLHGILVICIIVGSLAAISGVLHRSRVIEFGYYLIAASVALSQLRYGECIMTVWEKSLRNANEPGSAYKTSCIHHYFPWLPLSILNLAGPALLIGSVAAGFYWHRFDALKAASAMTKP